MFEIRHNTQTQNSTNESKLNLTLKGKELSVSIEKENKKFESILPLKSYCILKCFQEGDEAIFFVDVNKINSIYRLDRKDFKQAPHDSGYIFSIKTGIISDNIKDILIDNKDIKKANVKIKADIAVISSDFDFKRKINMQDKTLLDYFSLSVNGQEYKSDGAGNITKGDITKPIIPNGEYIEFIIKKYKQRFEEPLTRDIDNDEITIESSAGLINVKRAYMTNGIAKFRLYPFGYIGKIKIKLGRRWYENLNEYNLILGGL